MQNSPKYWFFIVLLLLELGVAWLVLFLLKKIFPYYRNKNVVHTYWLLTAGSLLIIILGRFSPSEDLAAQLMRLAFVWLIGQIAVLVFMPLIYAVARLTKASQPAVSQEEANNDNNITRRKFLHGMVTVLPAASLGITAYGVYVGGSEIILQRHNLAFPQLPNYLENFKIAQISDTHIGLYFSIDKFEQVLEKVLAEKPDMLVITGDLIDEVNLVEQAIANLSEIAYKFPYGIYFCWGNHEYFRNINRIRHALKNSAVTLLENNAIKIIDSEKPFYLAGVDYPWAKNADQQISERARMMGQVMADIPDNAFTVLLSHHPDFIVNAFDNKIPLTLTGHTHGGQVTLFGHSLLPVRYRYMRGLYRQGDSCAYVHVGTGSWMPFRLNCPAEIAVFTLNAKETAKPTIESY